MYEIFVVTDFRIKILHHLLTLFTLGGGGHMAPLVKIAPEKKTGPGGRLGLLALLLHFSYGCFLKFLRYFHDSVKSRVARVFGRNHDLARSDTTFSSCPWYIHWTLGRTFLGPYVMLRPPLDILPCFSPTWHVHGIFWQGVLVEPRGLIRHN